MFSFPAAGGGPPDHLPGTRWCTSPTLEAAETELLTFATSELERSDTPRPPRNGRGSCGASTAIASPTSPAVPADLAAPSEAQGATPLAGVAVAARGTEVKDRGVPAVIEEFWPGRRGDAFDEHCPG